MKVTGWTEWGDDNYIDITHENMRKRCEVMSAFPLPSFDEFMKIPEEDREIYLEKRRIAVDIAFEDYYKDNKEMESLEQEIRDVVIEDIRNNGYHFFGEHHQNHEYGTPIIDDKYIYCVSMRDWGSIMADAYPDEDYDGYGLQYCKWAWYNPELRDSIMLPSGR